MLTFALAALSLLVPSVLGHGYVQTIVTKSPSATWPGWNPNVDPYLSPTPQRVMRKIPGNGPVTDLSLIDVQCNGYTDGGFATAPAGLSASVAAGSQIALNWTTWPDSHVGPIITYMAKVPSGQSVTSWLPGTSAVWFKVAAAGKTGSGTTTGWAATDGLTATNSIYTFTVPAALAPGQYIIRHEIIALHAAYTYPGAQVYPDCIQVTVTGSGTKTPASPYLVAFPGAYTASTPGIVYDVYTNTSAYPIPGPAIWTGA